MNNIKIIRSRRDDSCYEFEVENQKNGTKSRAFLTYELFPAQSFERTLLLCEDVNFFVKLLISPEQKVAFGTLNDLLKAPKNLRLGVAKSIVNRLIDNELSISGARIAVHTYGPVPVIALDEKVEIAVHGRPVKANLAVFPKHKHGDGGSAAGFPFFISTKSEFRKSMSRSPQLVFQRYLEDVAEDFHDLRRTLRRDDFFRRARNIEKTLSASIGSKLKNFVPKQSLAKFDDEDRKNAWTFFKEHAEMLYEVSIARYWAFFLLNEVYETVGMFSISQDYRKKC
jgi:hypothetical protein